MYQPSARWNGGGRTLVVVIADTAEATVHQTYEAVDARLEDQSAVMLVLSLRKPDTNISDNPSMEFSVEEKGAAGKDQLDVQSRNRGGGVGKVATGQRICARGNSCDPLQH